MSKPESQMTDTMDLLAELEAAHPGFVEVVAAERRRLHAEHPDPKERRSFLLSHFVRLEKASRT
jgi:hypothetical protein